MYKWNGDYGDGSRTAATYKMERFVKIVNGRKPLISITKRSILNVATALDLVVPESCCTYSRKSSK